MALEGISFFDDVSKDWQTRNIGRNCGIFFTEMFSQQRFQAWKCRENLGKSSMKTYS
jgi:hypothetical protein